jgi:RNA polymerase sigma-70 factor (ECF subfamily)
MTEWCPNVYQDCFSVAFAEEPVREDDNGRIIRLVQQGDTDAFEDLVLRHQDRVFNTALRLLGDHEEAADVTQEVFVSCFRKIGSFRGDARFTTWLYRVTVNAVKNRWKHMERRGGNKTVSLQGNDRGDEMVLQDRLAAKGPSPRHSAGVREMHEILLEKLQELHADYREVLVVRGIECLSYEEIAAILGCSLGTVKSRLHRARELIRKKMRDYL